ncbi:DMT family transporter [Nocardiopsis sp. RSe5-2]|uniref:DMT family transporter n=1 Tax=Nocardiopsis endophytica TaxID=3018445 RepID=A0ABT4UDS5_9ACTN|nr:DMT family transporter [Nocardiopsis endophytica]MDA2815113.1 DMT family transporter [Nocardiopsis endophytica]
MLLRRIDPVLLALAGAACTSLSAPFVKASGADAGTAAFLRCALALPPLALLAAAELRSVGPRPRRFVLTDAAAGLLLGADFVLWAASIELLGAGVATVLLNVQIIVFPLLARVASGERTPRGFGFAAAAMLAGLALASGALAPSGGADAVIGALFGAGAGTAYAGYLFLSRLGGGKGHTATPVCTSTAAAAVSAATIGGLWTGLHPGALDASGWAWLTAVALLGQVLTWLLVGAALPRLAPGVGAAVMVLPPVMALAVGAVFLGERLSLLQLTGCAVVVAAVWAVERMGRRSAAPRRAPRERTATARQEP